MIVTLREDESFESLLNRFTKMIQNSELLSEMKRREYYEKPSDRRRRKKNAKMRKVRLNALRSARD